MDTAGAMIDDAKVMGRNPYNEPHLARQIADFVNVASGRGGGRFLRQHMIGLNAVFFSPRFIASRVTLMNPAYYLTRDPVVRKAAMRGLLSLGAFALTTLSLARLAGAEIGMDPRKSTFLKIKVGNTYYDIFGGFQQFARFAAEMAMGPENGTRWDSILRFFESKATPIVTFAIGLMRGTTMIGKPFKVVPEVLNRFTPMAIGDAWQLVNEHGLAPGAAMAVPGVFGVGVQTYDEKKGRRQRKRKVKLPEWL
jgi:hypothetical protein